MTDVMEPTLLKPAAFQELNRQQKVVRFSYCPEHQRRSSDYRGMQKELITDHTYWVFKCKEKGGHLFLTEADPNVPPVGDAAAERKWWLQQLQRLAEKGDKSKRGQ